MKGLDCIHNDGVGCPWSEWEAQNARCVFVPSFIVDSIVLLLPMMFDSFDFNSQIATSNGVMQECDPQAIVCKLNVTLGKHLTMRVTMTHGQGVIQFIHFK